MVVKSSSHAKYDLKYHFVWCPKYRKMVLGGKTGKCLARAAFKIAERYDFEIVELAVMPDHVRLYQ